MRDERIEVIYVQLGFKQSGHEALQIGWDGFDNDELAFGERELLAVEHFSSAFRNTHHHTDNGGVVRAQNHQTEPVNMFVSQEPNQIVQAPQPIRGEYGKLYYRISPPHHRCLCWHSLIQSSPPY